MRTAYVALVLALCGLLAAAAPVPKDQGESPYYPTKVGMKLVYDYQEVGELIFVVTEVKDIKGGKRVTVERRNLKEPIIAIFEATGRGLVEVEHGEQKLAPPVVILPTPVRSGDKWSYKLPEAPCRPGVECTHTVVGVEKLKVPGGTFEAVRVDTEYKGFLRDAVWDYKYSRWYAPHVGLVQEKLADGKLVAVLKSITLPKE
jgi:hypothetical protein